jgi:putative spermidine/putrescine transport system substrate-binding protein
VAIGQNLKGKGKSMKYGKILALGAAVAAVGAAGVVSAQDKSLTVVSWGGAYTVSQVEAYHKPFIAKTGIQIKSEDYNGGIAQIKAQVKSGKVTWDIVDVELADAIRACDEGLLETIDATKLPPGKDGTPATEDFIKGTLHDCAVANIIWSTIYAYDSSKITGDKPTTMADFFDLKKFPGKRGLRKNPKVNLEFALIADGVAAADVYTVLATPEGVDRAFKKLDTIKSEVVWWEAGAQPPQLLADGQVAMTTAYNGRIFNAVAKENKPFVIVWDGQGWDLDLWVIPKGAPNKQAALDFLAFSTETEQLANQAKYIAYAPARKSSVGLVGKYQDGKIDMGPQMPTSPENFKNAFQTSFEFWADRQDELTKRFNAWLAK